MKSIADYRAQILGSVRQVGIETVSYREAVGRVLRATVTAAEAVPAFSNSAMDGYAVRSEDVSQPGATLSVVGEISAGVGPSREVGPGEAIKIMTGAPMPDGADTVVRVEDTESVGGDVRIGPRVEPGTSVRLPGSDLAQGADVVPAGRRMESADVGVLASVGAVEVEVSKRPKVAVLSTGDEVMAAEKKALGPGQIRDSNRPMLLSLVQEAGAVAVDFGRVPDEEAALKAALGEAAATCDLIVTSGGVSMGDYDVVKAVLSDVGVEFFPLAMKPGKPQGFGQLGGTPFFGLPGNPVSVFVSFEQFVRPALLAMQGASALLRPRMRAVAGESFKSDPVKAEFFRGVIAYEPHPVVRRAGGQGSHVLSGVAGADVFAISPVGSAIIKAGETMEVELFTAAATRSIDV